ncbi:hypothetical protein GUITHDRAFT_83536 [Guillardia theta CCMP2712]|uniref:Uncharacterized protein n=1 Tax=Guillardia theta (strain CCMP2712) TaxID=905079 RepID=L1I3Z1_GUITC|nr:hypothetical protein GUITHDRAFT_83536 [Guillardia theta CCMP2712]EKX30973.1 hypothetical protein GUITHDRAFT_83536 [Guillardia theta CCMP2712]|eukprot:XP_005817953.1 hypothetical protein GUITHDRAFT_83536 [Guillardia theta CCMP2712]
MQDARGKTGRGKRARAGGRGERRGSRHRGPVQRRKVHVLRGGRGNGGEAFDRYSGDGDGADGSRKRLLDRGGGTLQVLGHEERGRAELGGGDRSRDHVKHGAVREHRDRGPRDAWSEGSGREHQRSRLHGGWGRGAVRGCSDADGHHPEQGAGRRGREHNADRGGAEQVYGGRGAVSLWRKGSGEDRANMGHSRGRGDGGDGVGSFDRGGRQWSGVQVRREGKAYGRAGGRLVRSSLRGARTAGAAGQLVLVHGRGSDFP